MHLFNKRKDGLSSFNRLIVTSTLLLVSAISYADSALVSTGDKPTPLTSQEAFVLVKMDHSSLAGIRKGALKLTNNNQLAVNIEKDFGMQLLKVKAGIYKPKIASLRHIRGIVIEPGTVTYIGDWHLYSGQQVKVDGQTVATTETGYRLNFDVDTLQGYAENNPWLKQYPLHISHINGKRVINDWTFGDS